MRRHIVARLYEPTKRIRCELGEAPIWDSRKGRLLWVDVEASRIFVHSPDSTRSKEVEIHDLKKYSKYVSTVVSVDGYEDTVVLGVKEGFAKYDLKRRTFEAHPSNPIRNREGIERHEERFNDGKVDPQGRLWAGTLVRDLKTLDLCPKEGSLYVLSNWSRESPPARVVRKVTCSNGLCWTGKTMFYIDSPTFAVDSFDYGDGSKSLGDIVKTRKTRFHVSTSFPPVPDGMIADTEGCLWVAHFGTGCVRRINPDDGRVLLQIDLPPEAGDQCTAVAWGGSTLGDLFITTAHEFWNEEKKEKFPLAGKLFHVPASELAEACGFDRSHGKRTLGVAQCLYKL